MSAWILPLLLTILSLLTLRRDIDPYETLLHGASEGLLLLPRLLPSLIALLTASAMLRASGFFDLLATLLAPLLGALGISPELLPLMLLQPLSGSGSMALAADLMARHGAESEIGRMAAVLIGSSETTFYTVAVYFGAAEIRKSRHAIPAALVGDAVGMAAAIAAVKWLFPA